MKPLFFSLICSLASSMGFSQVQYEKIIGKWVEQSVNGPGFVECPYRLEFSTKAKYEIFNVCLGFDAMRPVTEEGTWSYNLKTSLLQLRNRKTYDNDLYVNSDTTLDIHIKELKGDILTVYFNKPKIVIVLERVK